MKITQSKLKEIIRETILGEQDTGTRLSPELPAIDDRILQQLKDLHEAWRPETDEGRQYKDDLGKLIGGIEPTWHAE